MFSVQSDKQEHNMSSYYDSQVVFLVSSPGINLQSLYTSKYILCAGFLLRPVHLVLASMLKASQILDRSCGNWVGNFWVVNEVGKVKWSLIQLEAWQSSVMTLSLIYFALGQA